jgi:hypothetical protein
VKDFLFSRIPLVGMSDWLRDLDGFLDRVKSITPFRRVVREQAELARQYQKVTESQLPADTQSPQGGLSAPGVNKVPST